MSGLAHLAIWIEVRVLNKGHSISYRPLSKGILDLRHCYLSIYRPILPDISRYMAVSPIPLCFPIPRFETLVEVNPLLNFHSCGRVSFLLVYVGFHSAMVV